MARAGGKEPEKLADALAEAERLILAALKVIALDYGPARTGVAVSDATGTLARPLGVVEGPRLSWVLLASVSSSTSTRPSWSWSGSASAAR